MTVLSVPDERDCDVIASALAVRELYELVDHSVELILCDHVADLFHHIRIESRSHSDCLRKHSCNTCPGHPV